MNIYHRQHSHLHVNVNGICNKYRVSFFFFLCFEMFRSRYRLEILSKIERI